MKHKTLKQLFPEMDWKQRTQLGHHLSKVLDVRIDQKVKEKHNMVRLYHESTHHQITFEAAKLFTPIGSIKLSPNWKNKYGINVD
jgi:hypothetical protein